MWASSLGVRARRASNSCEEDWADNLGRGVSSCTQELAGERGPRGSDTGTQVREHATTLTGQAHDAESRGAHTGVGVGGDRWDRAGRGRREAGRAGGKLGLMGRKA
jgi:hypothetical protein